MFPKIDMGAKFPRDHAHGQIDIGEVEHAYLCHQHSECQVLSHPQNICEVSCN
jgi:hypothetical protein